MRLRELETRILKLERDPAHTRLGRMSEEELDAAIIRELNEAAADFPTYDALVEDMTASPVPNIREGAKNLRWFLDDYLFRQAQPAAQ